MLVRVVRAAVVAIVSVYALYLLAINVFLSTSLFQRMLGQDPETLDIHYASAWSVFPTRIHARDLSIRSSDSNVEWILRLDEVTFDVSLLSLVRQRFEVSFAHGHGISMRARQKLDRTPDTVAEVATLAPVDGFPAYSVRPALPPHPERWDDAQYHLWTVLLEDVVAEDVRELWIDHERFTGSARITGRFYLKPIRAVEIGPAHVDIREGKVAIGKDGTLVDTLGGTVDATVERFDPRDVPGNTVFRHVSVAAELHASFADMATSLASMDLPFAIRGTVDAPRISAHVDHGRVVRGTHLEIATKNLSIAKDDHIGHGLLTLHADIAADDVLHAIVEGSDLGLVRGDGHAVLNLGSVRAAADARALDLAADQPFADAHLVFDAPRVDLADARVLNRYIPSDTTPVEIVEGSAHAAVHLEAWPHDRHAAGYASLEAPSLDLRVAKMRIRGSFGTNGSFGAWRWDEDLFENARGHLHVSHASFASSRTPDRTMLTATDLALDLRAKRVTLDDPLRDIDDASFDMPAAKIVDRGMLRQYLPKGNKLSVASLGDQTAFSVTGHLSVADHVARGDLHAHANELALMFGSTATSDALAVRAMVDARAKVHDWHWERGDLALDRASLDIRDVTMTTSGAPHGDRSKKVASIQSVSVHASSPAFAFSDPLGHHIDLRAKVTGGSVVDPVAVDAFLPDDVTYGFATEQGEFEADVHLAVTDHVARGRVSASAHRMGLRTKPITVLGDASVAVDIGRWDTHTSMMTLASSRATLTNVRGRFGPEDDRSNNTPSKGNSEILAKKIELTGSAKDLDFASPSLRGVDARFVLDDAELRDARGLNRVIPAGTPIAIESGAAHATADVRISATDGTASGGVTVNIAKAGMSIHETKLTGDFGIRASVHAFDPNTGVLDVSGTNVAMTNVTVKNASAETRGWSAVVRLEDATVHTHDAPALHAMVRLNADDARPVLAVVLRDSIPKFLVSFIDMPNLAVRAKLDIAPQVLSVSDVYGSGGDVAFRGSYGVFDTTPPAHEPPEAAKDVKAKQSTVTTALTTAPTTPSKPPSEAATSTTKGAFIVSKGGIAVGVRIGDDGAHAHFFGLEKWLTAQETVMKSSRPRPEKKAR